MARVRPSALSSRGEDYRVRIPRKICFGLMGPFRRVNALVRLENVCTRHDRGKRNGFFSKGRRKEKKKGNERQDAVYWKLADIKCRERNSWTLEKPCPGTDK